jgi:N-acetylglucosamine malate deacetylase 1
MENQSNGSIMLQLGASNTVLVLAPHTDDGEFGCGGTIAALASRGARVVYVAFSAAEASVPVGFESDILRQEVKEATVILGIKPEDCICLKYPVRHFPAHRQEILEDMVRLGKEYQPDVVFLPSRFDTHQDHAVIVEEGFRAFKRCTMFGYEIPWNNLEFRANGFFKLSDQSLQTKIEALACYRSQAGRVYASSDFIRSLAFTRGVQIGAQYAECFEIIRWVI